MRKFFFVIFFLVFGEAFSVCRFPASTDSFSFLVNRSRIGTVTNHLQLKGEKYTITQTGQVSYLLLKDSYKIIVTGNFINGFQPERLNFTELKKNTRTSREIAKGQFDSLSMQLQLRYALLHNAVPHSMAVWMNNKLNHLSIQKNRDQTITVPAFKKSIVTTPITYRTNDGIYGTFWFAKNYGYRLVDYAITNPSKKSKVAYILLSMKNASDCFAH